MQLKEFFDKLGITENDCKQDFSEKSDLRRRSDE